MEANPGAIVWKDIRCKNGEEQKWEAKRFWACLMFLEILPAKEGVFGGNEWRFPSGYYRQDQSAVYHTPQTRHDELVSSHATSCEHQTFFFTLYHRNLMTKYILALQEADYCLRKLHKRYFPDESSETETDEKFRWMVDKVIENSKNRNSEDSLKEALTEYNEILQKNKGKKWVTPFYWDVSDYRQQIFRPAFFDGQEDWLKDLRKYFFEYKGWNFGQVNFGEWLQKDYKGRPDNEQEKKNELQFTKNQEQFLAGTLKDVKNFQDGEREERILKQLDELLKYVNPRYREKIKEISLKFRNNYIKDYLDQKEKNQKQKQNQRIQQNLKLVLSHIVQENKELEGLTSEIKSLIFRLRINNIKGNILDYTSKFIFDQYNKKRSQRKIFTENSLPNSVINAVYGGKGFEYINPGETQFPSTFINDYNNTIPYYSFAKALIELENQQQKKKEVSYGSYVNFIQGGGGQPFQNGHNMGHNNSAMLLSHGAFSIKNPIFFLYHGYIEYMHELSIKQLKIKGTLNYNSSKLSNFFDKPLDKKAGKFGERFFAENSDPKYSDYPAFEWTYYKDKYTKAQYVYYDIYKNLIIGEDKLIRGSDNIYSYFKKQLNNGAIVIPNELKDYPFNYTFDAFTQRENKNGELDYPKFKHYIPDHLMQIITNISYKGIERLFQTIFKKRSIVEETKKVFHSGQSFEKIVQTVKTSEETPINRQQRGQLENSLLLFFKQDIEAGVGPSKLVGKTLPEENKENIGKLNDLLKIMNEYKEKVQRNHVLKGRIQYPASIRNGNYTMGFSLEDPSCSFHNSLACTKTNSLFDKIVETQNFYTLHVFSVFGKGDMYKTCPNCREEKVVFIDLLKYFFGFDYHLLFDLHAHLNLGVVYDDSGKNPIEKGMKDLIKGRTSHEYENITLKILYGARQVAFNFYYSPDLEGESYYMMPDNNDFEIIIHGNTKDVGTDAKSISLKAHRKSLSRPVNFEELENPDSVNRQKNEADLVYDHFDITVIVRRGEYRENSLIKRISFDVKNFYESIEYDFLIHETKKEGATDYQFLIRNKNYKEIREIFF